MSNEGYHEPISELTDETRDMHRAITSLMEELEAVDWYNQRVDACKDDELRAILAHNRDEEKEHEEIEGYEDAENTARQNEEECEEFAWAVVNAPRDDHTGEHHQTGKHHQRG